MNGKIIYCCKYSKLTNGEPNVPYKDSAAYNCLSQGARDFLDLAVSFARKHKDDIFVKLEDNLSVKLTFTIGSLFGSFKDMFEELMQKSEAVLMMPGPEDKDIRFSLTVNFFYGDNQ